MSRVKELLEKYNPDGVPNKLLVECSLIDYGYPFASSMFTDDSSYIPIIRIRDVKPGKASTYYMGNYSKEYIVKRGDILVGMDGEFNLEKWNDIDSLLNQRVARITEMPSKSTKGYLYHILGPIFKKIEREISGGSVKHLSVKIINSISIPLPHIKVQEEIVKILDSFTNLIDALNEELSLRQKQFEYYREKLLTFDDNVEKSIVTEVAQLKSGLTYKPSDVSDKGILVLRSSNIKNGFLSYDDNVFVKESTKISDRSIVRCNDILICVRNGSKKLVGKCAMIDKNADGMAFGAFMSVLRAKDINPKYLFYVWSSQIIQDKIKGDDAAPINQITSKDFNRLLIPVPKEQIQQSIVEKLDAFESLISSLKEEIALRQKQYEYYREKLLTFD